MKKLLIIFIAVLFITLVIPLAVVYILGQVGVPKPYKPSSDDERVNVFLADEGRVEEMSVNDYLMGVVASEMPSDYENEALKAQAVVSRTYLYYKINQFNSGSVSEAHPDAPVCTDYKHCQSYTSREVPDNIAAAVTATSGEYITYNGEVISALYHSASSGVTEAAADVWGNDVPYLQSVRSEGDIESPKYLSSATMSRQEFMDIAEANIDGVDWSKPLYDNIERSDAGGIISLEIGGARVRGTDFRAMYNLRSANAELTEKDGNIIISVRGYGHGVGMSQYGANYMAREGSSYDEILKNYYTGIELAQKN